jgi:hypothetical protein
MVGKVLGSGEGEGAAAGLGGLVERDSADGCHRPERRYVDDVAAVAVVGGRALGLEGLGGGSGPVHDSLDHHVDVCIDLALRHVEHARRDQ